MVQIALCDDDIEDLNTLIGYLKQIYSLYRFEYVPYTSGTELIQAYKNNRRFHMIILDMCMKPINGIETAEAIRKYDQDVAILIVTNSSKFAIEGYKVQAVRYLLKPVQRTEFLSCVTTILERFKREDSVYFLFSTDQGLNKVRYSDIYFFESDVRDIHLHTKNEEYLFRGQIGKLVSSLPADRFIRVHKSFILNLAYVKSIGKESVLLDNGADIPLSKHRRRQVKSAFMDFLMEKMVS